MGGVRMLALHQVPPTTERAVVINVATEVVSSLAIASALRHLDMPLLVINCSAEGVSRRFMDTLRDNWKFDLIDLPLALHGITLDRLFRELHCDRLTILDSDAEITDADRVKQMRASFDDTKVYGSGYVHGATWLEEHSPLRVDGAPVPILYAERPWIPFAMFRTSYVRAAIDAGASFKELYGVGSGINGLQVPQDVAAEHAPVAIHGDTGAEIHSWLIGEGYRFDGPDVATNDGEVRHYHGVTRTAISPDARNATPLDRIEGEVLQRLREIYPERWAGFASAIKSAQT